jgi:hypothetical protein
MLAMSTCSVVHSNTTSNMSKTSIHVAWCFHMLTSSASVAHSCRTVAHAGACRLVQQKATMCAHDDMQLQVSCSHAGPALGPARQKLLKLTHCSICPQPV